MEHDTVTIIIPTLNEAEGIGSVIENVPVESLEKRGYDTEILVIDGGSSDGTKEKVKEHSVRLLEKEGGKAEAVRHGLEKGRGDIFFLVDGDGSYPVDAITELIDGLEDGKDMVLGSRLKGEIEKKAMSFTNYFGNKMLTWLANRLYGTEVTDICTGLRGFKKDSLNGNRIPGKGFEIEAGLHIALSEGKISEVPIRYKQRMGHSKLRTIDGLKIGFRLLKEIY